MHRWKLILGLTALPFALPSGAASAAISLDDQQMDAVTAGFTSLADADAQALGKIVATLSATVSQVAVVTTTNAAGATVPVTASYGETTLTLIKSLAGSQSASSATNSLPTASLGLSSP